MLREQEPAARGLSDDTPWRAQSVSTHRSRRNRQLRGPHHPPGCYRDGVIRGLEVLSVLLRADIEPLRPWSHFNDLLGWIEPLDLRLYCMRAGVCGLLAWYVRGVWRKRRQRVGAIEGDATSENPFRRAAHAASALRR